MKISFNTNVIALISSKIKNNCLNHNNSGEYKLKCSCGKFYTSRINTRDFNTRCQEHISETKLNKNIPESDFAKHVLDTEHPINNNLDVLHRQNNLHITNVLEELEIYNKVKNNNFNHTLNIQTDSKNNIIYHFLSDNNNNIISEYESLHL